jgi:hypothetical protein
MEIQVGEGRRCWKGQGKKENGNVGELREERSWGEECRRLRLKSKLFGGGIKIGGFS